MIDQTVVRGKIGNANFAKFRLEIDGSKLLTEYAMEVIRTQTKLALVEGVSLNLEPEEVVTKTASRVIKVFAEVAMNRIKKEMKDIVSQGPEAFQKLVQEVMLGTDGENTEAGEGGASNE